MMNLEAMNCCELSIAEANLIEGGNWYNIYRIVSGELEDFIQGFSDAYNM